MAYSRIRTGLALRIAALALTIGGAAWMMAQTRWYVATALVFAAALAQIVALVRMAGMTVAYWIETWDPLQWCSRLNSRMIVLTRYALSVLHSMSGSRERNEYTRTWPR